MFVALFNSPGMRHQPFGLFVLNALQQPNINELEELENKRNQGGRPYG
jgi:hypothetical protein